MSGKPEMPAAIAWFRPLAVRPGKICDRRALTGVNNSTVPW